MSLPIRFGVAVLFATFCQGAPIYNVLSENFNNVSAMSSWVMLNQSSPAGSTGWFQGNSGVFPSQSGAANSYAAANFLNAGFGGDISNWLISPLLTFNNGDLISFYSRTEISPAPGADRMELRFNANGSTNVGTTAASVGDFTSLMLTVNPTLTTTGYPAVWTQYSALVSGLSGPTSARFALRYFVTNTSLNGNYVGVDTLSVLSEVPEPGTIWTLGAAGILLIARRIWRNDRLTRGKASPIMAVTATAVCLLMQAAPVFGADQSRAKAHKSKKATGKAHQARGSAGMRIFIDPQTGETREAPARQDVRQTRGSSTVVVNHSDGSRTAILGDDQMVYSVARINSDGSMSISHANAGELKKSQAIDPEEKQK